MLKNQKFGVEIEFTGITRRKAAGIVAKVLNTHVPLAESNVYKTRTMKDSEGRKWKVMRDSSVDPERADGVASDEYRVEFVTPPLRYTDIETLQKIVDGFKKAGAITNQTCGIHIHVDGANHDALSLRRLVKFFSARQQLVFEALKVSAVRSSKWCKPVNQSLIGEMAKVKNITRSEMESIWYSTSNGNYSGRVDHSHYNNTRYHGLNLHSFFSKGTVEFRLFNSTMHAEKITAYIQFCLAISAWAIETNDRCSFRDMSSFDDRLRRDMMLYILRDKCKLVGSEFAIARKWLMEGFKPAA